MRHYKAGPPIWVQFRRALDKTDLKFYISSASADTPWQHIALAGATRWRVEEVLEDGKLHLGMADYEARAWSSWHHHMALVALGQPLRDVDQAQREKRHPGADPGHGIAASALGIRRTELSEEEAIHLVEYHLERNRVAHDSHRKSWLRKHKELGRKLLL